MTRRVFYSALVCHLFLHHQDGPTVENFPSTCRPPGFMLLGWPSLSSTCMTGGLFTETSSPSVLEEELWCLCLFEDYRLVEGPLCFWPGLLALTPLGIHHQCQCSVFMSLCAEEHLAGPQWLRKVVSHTAVFVVSRNALTYMTTSLTHSNILSKKPPECWCLGAKDMGCAKFATNSTYTVTGTPDYFAPEMIKVNPWTLCPWLIISCFVNLKNICCYHLTWYSMVCITLKKVLLPYQTSQRRETFIYSYISREYEVIFCVPPGLWAWRQCRLVGTGCFGLRTVGRKTTIWVGVSISETWLDVNFRRFGFVWSLIETGWGSRQITVWLMYFWSHYIL